MTYSLVLWAHVLVMGYWLGSELVINALSHYVTRTTSLSGEERRRQLREEAQRMLEQNENQ